MKCIVSCALAEYPDMHVHFVRYFTRISNRDYLFSKSDRDTDKDNVAMLVIQAVLRWASGVPQMGNIA